MGSQFPNRVLWLGGLGPAQGVESTLLHVLLCTEPQAWAYCPTRGRCTTRCTRTCRWHTFFFGVQRPACCAFGPIHTGHCTYLDCRADLTPRASLQQQSLTLPQSISCPQSSGVDGVKVDCQAGVGLVGSALGGGAALSRTFHTALEVSAWAWREAAGSHAGPERWVTALLMPALPTPSRLFCYLCLKKPRASHGPRPLCSDPWPP